MIPDASSVTDLAKTLAEPHLFMAMLLAMVLIFSYLMFKAYSDRHEQMWLGQCLGQIGNR